jgi:cation:H+ antiporter
MPGLATGAALFLGSLLVLIVASDRFISATARVGLSIGVSPYIIGATVVAGGTSLPELVSSLFAATQGETAIVIGNVVGSNVANLFVILGLAAVVGGAIRVERELMRVDLPILVVSAAFLLIAGWNGRLEWYEGVLALVGLAIYVHFTLAKPARLDETVEELVETHADGEVPDEPVTETELDELATETRVGTRTYVLLVGSLALVVLAAAGLVQGIVDLAGALGVGTELVAITAVGFGTSLPEIAVSLTAVRRGDPEIAVGNVLGSNVFNTFFVVGLPSLVAPLSVPATVRTFALPVMLLATVLHYFITQDREITRWEGGVLLLLYAVFLLTLLELA